MLQASFRLEWLQASLELKMPQASQPSLKLMPKNNYKVVLDW